ncbi:uncharacterized protein involved in exopolysaccharide biosynthesis [Chitinophaga terrae (ex Kim and Jung 2007)]|uniref:Wzz/FepE/Etk N-terminal domain-containing protein n=1 Tax=Chitinophaga terrae (ex Kim and Jung 2007) TaxID=408074 RepID=UPI0027863739|nr:Wzz/FepE/Etk N-terminal domain-containing protein [Chitinophaga terrae (ex Kim and Jung 2007)]MDQ0105765.1 uncharacterized protein involved in exopolysaccharide biosynthesis [Chitinophaga terrae (ex Kim and Jung 2007)]
MKDLIIKTGEWCRYLWKKKWKIVIAGIIGGALGVVLSFVSKPKYKAQLTFVLEEGKTSALGAYAGIASQFGLDLGGVSSNGAFAGDNIMELLESRLLTESALLTGHVAVNGKNISLAEYFTEFTGMRKHWEEDTQLVNLHFPYPNDRTKFTLKQDSVLNVIRKTVTDKYLFVGKPDKKLSFISVSCTSPDEVFSKVFSETLLNEAIDLYLDTKTRRNKQNVDRLQAQADSLQMALNRKTYTAASVQDLNANPAKQVASVGTELAMRDKMVLQNMYFEVIKNLELSKLTMAQETPVIQIIDRPIYPLEKTRLGKLKGLILGGIAGGFIGVIVLVLMQLYRKIME